MPELLDDYTLEKRIILPEGNGTAKRDYRLVHVGKLEGIIFLTYHDRDFQTAMVETWRRKDYNPEPINLVEMVEETKKLLEKR